MDYISIKRKKRKGFTLVELLVVIAILAVLASVSVVGYLGFVKRARVSNDVSLTTQMNTVLQSNEVVDGKNDTPYEAITELKDDGGFDVNKISPTANGYFFGYDKQDNRMVLFDEGMNVIAPEGKSVDDHKRDVFLLIANESEIESTTEYSYYLKDNFVEDSTPGITVSTGLDVGENEISTINYTSSSVQDVLIRSNTGTTVNINEGDVIRHYGYADIVNITKVSTSSYHEYGTVGSLTIDEGKIQVEDTGYIAQATINNSAQFVAENDTKVGYLVASESATITGATVGVREKKITYTDTDDNSKKTYSENEETKTALFVSTADELNNALNGITSLDGISKVVLGADLSIEHTSSASNITVKVSTTFDLNGHTITCDNKFNDTSGSNSFFSVQGCSFRLVDTVGKGRIIYNNTYSCNVDLFILGQNQATANTTFTLDSGIIEFNSSNSNAGTYCFDVMDNHANYTVSLIINGGSILCNGSGTNNAEAIRLYDNGASDDANRNVYVEINNGYITGDIYFQGGLETSNTHKGETTLVINGGTIIAARAIRSTFYTMSNTNHWGNAVITLNGGNITSTIGFGDEYLSYDNIIGTSYDSTFNITGWTAEKIFNITDNR